MYQREVSRLSGPTAAAVSSLLLASAESAVSLQLQTVRHASSVLDNKEGVALDTEALDTVRHANEVAAATLARLGGQGGTTQRVTVTIGQANDELRLALGGTPGSKSLPAQVPVLARGPVPAKAPPIPLDPREAHRASKVRIIAGQELHPDASGKSDRRTLRECAHGVRVVAGEVCEKCLESRPQVPVFSGGPQTEILEAEGEEASDG